MKKKLDLLTSLLIPPIVLLVLGGCAAEDSGGQASDNGISDASPQATRDSAVADVSSDAQGGSADQDPLLEEWRASGNARVAIANQPPYAELTPDGTLTGMVPELTKEITAALGVEELEPAVVTYESMIPGLQAGRWDVIAVGLTMTPERCQQALFTQPVVASDEVFVAASGSELGVTSYASVAERPDLRLGVVPGTSQETRALSAGVPEEQLVGFPDLRSLYDALNADRVDAFITQRINTAGEEGSYEVLTVQDGAVSAGGIAFREENADLRDLFDRELAELKQSGRFLELSRQYGFDGDLAMQTSRADVDQDCDR